MSSTKTENTKSASHACKVDETTQSNSRQDMLAMAALDHVYTARRLVTDTTEVAQDVTGCMSSQAQT